MAPTAVKPTTSPHFEAVYEAPFLGVASDMYDTDIQPGQFLQALGFNIRSGLIVTEFFNNGFDIFIGFPGSGVFVQQIVTILGVLVALDSAGNGYIYDEPTGVFILDQVLGQPVNIDCVQVINGAAYCFDYAASSMYIYVPLVAGATLPVGYTVGQIYAAGKYCCVVDGYLLTANSNQAADTPPKKPGRVNWSAPYQFAVWDAAVSRNAGFNVLADVTDEITGLFALGNVAFVLRTNGMTQLTPTGVAIQPFDFPTLMSGDFGIGCSFPDTLSVYGTIAAFGDSSDFYLFGGGAPQPITGSAKEAIYDDINALFSLTSSMTVSNLVSGCFYNSSLNNIRPELSYLICIATDAYKLILTVSATILGPL